MSLNWGGIEKREGDDEMSWLSFIPVSVLGGFAWYGALRLLIAVLRALGVHMVSQ